jgi:acyl-CoA thioesterase
VSSLPTTAATAFDHGIEVARRPDQPETYDVELGAGWQIGAGINGGMLLATVGSALRSTLEPNGHPDPVTITAYYLSASRPGPASVHTEVLRSGRSLSTGAASLVQVEDGRDVERIRALATFGDLAALPDDVHTTATPPDLPPPEECVSTSDAPPPPMMGEAGLLERLDLRLDPACVGWALGQPSRRGLIQGWLRMADGREPDPMLLLLAADALPPVTFDLGLFGWTPTLELTVHLRAVPAAGWLRVTHSTRNLAGGLLEEDAEVWDSDGRLVAQSRQLARAPRVR